MDIESSRASVMIMLVSIARRRYRFPFLLSYRLAFPATKLYVLAIWFIFCISR
ncbi:hypothetical protein ALC57_17915 [Trachymyrmex cornetzi]|uniref:Uncharacterized protein n=1 Tax=Trachymyrmex cornetzi TaxID=471704 RepID=A0A195DAK3_9HYME|nr:hypothetical protein ALC57_17915 [Trachymyrmex cornetzi]